MSTSDPTWVRVELRDAAGPYDGEVLARVTDGLVVNVLGAEHTFAGTHVFPTRAIASTEPPPYPRLHAVPKSGWHTRDRSVQGDSVRALLEGRPADRLLVVEELGDPEVCWIGFPTVDGSEVVLHGVDPDGESIGTERYAIDDLARVAWGGGYLLALEDRLRPGTLAVEHFAAAVTQFVEVIGAGAEPVALQRILAELHMRALDLPDWEEPGPVGGEAWPSPMELPDLVYWDMFDVCTQTPEEPVANSLANDLADVWGDLTEGRSMVDAGHRAAACHHWKLTHRAHWGEHALGALRALHLAQRS